MPVYCWPNVVDGGPAGNQHWFNLLCLLERINILWGQPSRIYTHNIDVMLAHLLRCWPNITAAWVNVSCLLCTDRIRSCLKNWILLSHSRIIFKNNLSYCQYTICNADALSGWLEMWITIIIQISTEIYVVSLDLLWRCSRQGGSCWQS